MKIFDKYIIKSLLSTFFFVVLILLAVIVVIDLTEKMDKFAKAGVTAEQVTHYYLDYMAWIGSFITPITMFIATVYVCSKMAGHSEVVAALSSGLSFRRFLLPFLAGATFIGIISFVMNGWIIPKSNRSRLEFEVQYIRNKYYFDKRNIHIQVAPNVYLYMQSYNNNTNTGYHFSIERFKDNRLVEKLTANRIEWDSVKHKWLLRDYKIRRIDRVFETTSHPNLSEAPDSLTKGASMDTALVIHPKEFESDYRKYDGMTMKELNRYIRTLKARGTTGVEVYEVEKYTRYSAPFSILILVFMGVIVSSRKSRGGTGLQIALGFVLSFIFILFFTLFRTFAEAGSTPPELSVWIPNIIFALISLGMYKYVPR